MFDAPKRRDFDRSGSLCHPQNLDTGTKVVNRGDRTWDGLALEWELRWADEERESATLLAWTEVVRFLHKRILVLAAFSLSHSYQERAIE